MIKVETPDYPIYFGVEGYAVLGEQLNEKNYSKLLILTDSTCNELCLPHFLAHLPTTVPFEIVEIEAGETAKNLTTCEGVWAAMLELGLDRYSALITVGGGVVSDLGGFVASVYMRGIDCYIVPTTLLAMVDASIGGKTGVDLDGAKNCIGSFAMPKMVVIDAQYLETLEARELKSGYAEMLKHGLIYDESYFNHLKDIAQVDFGDIETLIYHGVAIKSQIVQQDPQEQGLRKILNFGHSIGHAVESYYLTNPNKERMLHGEAIAIGMIIESYISTVTLGLNQSIYQGIKESIQYIYGKQIFSETEIEEILSWLKFDKKNRAGEIRMVLLSKIGEASYDVEVTKDLIFSGFVDYLK
ncbi:MULTISPECIES: 3-dehydroquinate synthase [unclassified Myroides]|uniref:3-dehydroquinate synthase n=1 Tax=unclassified Myroides TaxID=2642485 RepID=UPI0015F7B5EF|nr:MULTISPECIES: 3-dehydroquinate synthase [unclassified Myroides]MBB1150529.1 3-dehydroquinate synthase [Myroides sp. NP-2]MDM1407499.1 3-dehydroquinate synthase [Myroides sp. DF42-4-2]